MKKILLTFFTISLLFSSITAQNIKSPADFLGYELGTRFTRHYKVIEYFDYVSTNSANIKLEKYGETNEFRPLYISYISSVENISNLEKIRENNLKKAGIIEGNSNSETVIVWLSYNVHGNEASSTEASMQTLYDLITKKQEWLKNTLVIIDPCINPDGRDRYVNWYNETKSTPYNVNPDASEHNEPWPRGRANHYLFDLNRDWAWASQVETQQRLVVYNKWLPQVHVDFHEQGYNEPYYFAPAAEPFHEIITDWQRDFQTQLGKNHAKYFDQNGWGYFTKEFFDLLYPSYGDTYPTYMGAIGMTYEQAGIGAGLGITLENNSVLTFVDRVKHHTTTGLSTVELSSKNAVKLITEFGKFFDNSNLKYKSYILRGDKTKIKKLSELLHKHGIETFPSEEKSLKAYDYYSKSVKTIKTTKNDWIVSTNQPKGKMVKALLEPEAKLTDSVTYDITAWSLPFAYGLQGFASEVEIPVNKNISSENSIVNNEINTNTYSYICRWKEISDATFLGKLVSKGFKVRYSNTNFSVEGKNFTKGTLLIMRGENRHIENFDKLIVETANTLNKKLETTNTGFVDNGKDFGSENNTLISNKNIAVLSGEGTSSLSFGEIWHFFEAQLKYPLNNINTKNLNRIDLSKYDVLILPDGYIADKESLEKLISYVTNGGKIIAIDGALETFSDKEGFNLKKKKPEENKEPNLLPYNTREREYIKNTITGSIFKSTIDFTHPLAYGYSKDYYSLKLGANSYELLDKGINVGYFNKDATNISGFAGVNALKLVPESLLFGIENKGRGKIIYMVDNPLFRSFWENGKLFFANAVFLN
ncbi:M14 family metallopeptidase [Lutibacter sp. B1]|uniref:M14 family metallopeptidase n=1 Tax=Lutibacter sp. B1 TaxID=2725996 RepID=UPI0014565224|nr:M14 family metallopeptidase [Lutibacter sp. B1]NLP56561.1 zinc carboxypeptidase [Lutibacter sp. B1]